MKWGDIVAVAVLAGATPLQVRGSQYQDESATSACQLARRLDERAKVASHSTSYTSAMLSFLDSMTEGAYDVYSAMHKAKTNRGTYEAGGF